MSPITWKDKVKGLFCTCVDITEQVLNTRRQDTLRLLTLVGINTTTSLDAYKNSVLALATNSYDIPFAALYFSDDNASEVQLQALTGLTEHPFFPEVISLDDHDSIWPLKSVLTSHMKKEVDLFAADLRIQAGPWPENISKALILPISIGSGLVSGYLIVGFSPRRVIDQEYYTFFERVAAHIGIAVFRAKTQEYERQRSEELIKLDQAKTIFFSNVSHEFRTPLTLILGKLEKALATFPYANHEICYNDLKTIHRNSLRLQKLVNTLLDFASIEANRSVPKWELTHFSSFVNDLANVFRDIIEQGGLKFILSCDSLPCNIFIDREMWEKIIFNLLSNAFKFTFTGEIELGIRLIEQQVQVFVRDTGIGVEEAQLPNLFQRFHRVECVKSRTHEGSGIGLALVKELVQLHDGEIYAESQLGKGTTFFINFPLRSTNTIMEPMQVAQPYTNIHAPAFLSEANQWIPYTEQNKAPSLLKRKSAINARILIADDNNDMRYYLVNLLDKRWQVESVADGVSALQLLREKKFDLVLTDVMMPGLNGFELLKEIRQDPGLQDMCVIMLTACAGLESRIEGFENGADDYLIKPFSSREVLARVNAHLQFVERQKIFAENEILRQKNLQAEKNNHAKDLLLGTISHELRTPLTAILFSVQRLQKTNSHPLLKIIEENAIAQNQLIDTLLDTSSIILGKISIEKKELELVDAMKKIIDSVSAAAGEKSIVIELKTNSPQIIIALDFLRTRQIFWNLLMNAIKFTPAQGRIYVNLMKNSDEVQVSIQDTGKGIAPEFLPFIFERFSQEDMSYSREKGGLGIGLSLARDLILLQGGKINAESLGINKGATFTVLFPINELILT